MTKTTFKGRKTPTPKQTILIQKLIDNLGKEGERKTLGRILLDSGYSPNSADNPALITDSPTIQNGLKAFTDKLKLKREKALDYLDDNKLKKSNGRDLAGIVDILTKNHQLLGGEPTERIKISDEDRKLIDEAFEN